MRIRGVGAVHPKNNNTKSDENEGLTCFAKHKTQKYGMCGRERRLQKKTFGLSWALVLRRALRSEGRKKGDAG